MNHIVNLLGLCYLIFGYAQANISGTSPPNGACLCVNARVLNVRATACGTRLARTSTGDCFTYKGNNQYCNIGSTRHHFFNFDFNGRDGWAAGQFLTIGTAAQCRRTPPPRGDCSQVEIIPRSSWRARAPRRRTAIRRPPPMLFIHHTAGAFCSDQASCSLQMRRIQNFHIDGRGWSDIAYNFLIGEDGRVYEGRGWTTVPGATRAYNSRSLAFCMLGNFQTRPPNAAAISAVRNLIACAKTRGRLANNFEMFGHRDAGCTACPVKSADWVDSSCEQILLEQMAAEMSPKFKGRIICFVTGASQGLGRSIILSIAPRLPDGSVVLLHGRNKDRLEALSGELVATYQHLSIRLVMADLSTSEHLSDIYESFEKLKASAFSRAMIIHNASEHMGLTGIKTVELDDTEKITKCLHLHLTSTIVITSRFIKHFLQCSEKTIVNISAVVANRAISTLGLYAAGKAGREIFFKTMAVEDPSLRILNFDPGVMTTHMLEDHWSNCWDDKFLTFSKKMHAEGHMFKPDDVAEKLVNCLNADSYENGATVSVKDL
ncbi:unnamed protein product [Owenia fusiformis]|uniref:Uncharacterized protein n=1 Tax=Owenia fusiformis TaxID=6347 RepID=A0A8S4NC87_OWEFU|nr:unnamed protein product [Owenia fusiformis]